MRTSRRVSCAAAVVVICFWYTAAAVRAQSSGAAAPAALTCAEIETFLKSAKIGRTRDIPVGVTTPQRATLEKGDLKHDAAIQTADIHQPSYTTQKGTELNFRDTWKFNVAGYELAKMLSLNMVAPYVERRYSGGPAALSWWVNDAMMERDRVQKKLTPPDIARWNDEMQAARLFRELIGDYDFNQRLARLADRLHPGVPPDQDLAIPRPSVAGGPHISGKSSCLEPRCDAREAGQVAGEQPD